MPEININIQDCIIPMYDEVLKDILSHKHTHYVFPGGRGSCKSSFVGLAIPLIIVNNPQVHAACFRKIGNTIQNSIRAQIEWGISKLGLESLFLMPKSYANPIVFKPTGQCIHFLGLDKPQKIKSIKPKFGYIGVTWFEELDQFAGENELRTVTQSTMRGGSTYWDFRTFNPPISKNNWANMYAEKAYKRSPSTIVTRNTYLDVPPSWLGTQFFEEANELKEINPRAYEHEYLGIATGTGGDVFENACELDMTQMIPRFDHIYNGIDWGFARDPFRFVRMHFDAKKLDLYIFDEFTTYKTRNEDTFHRLYDEEKKIYRQELVTADSAEEKSVADFRAYGAFIRPAKKGPDSVRYGIKWLQGLRHIYIDKNRCPETYYEFVNYEYERDKDGNFISAYPDADNHSIDAVRYALENYCNRRGN
jgi:PBSX family phage terminase large subunit